MTYICYIDEAGCTTPLAAKKTDVQPILAIAGLIVDRSALAELTTNFLALKRKYFPGLFTSPHLLDDIREEVKGSNVRGAIRRRGLQARTELRYVDEILALLERLNCRVLASLWAKGVGKPFKAREIYTRSVQMACQRFQAFLDERSAEGLIVADFRTTQLNDQVAHSIFTQKYRAKGDPFARILELPTFGISNNHVGLQLTDVLCSTLLFPMASSAYCFGHVMGVHVQGRDLIIRRRYAKRIKRLQFRAGQHWSIGVVDLHEGRSAAELFAVPPLTQRADAGQITSKQCRTAPDSKSTPPAATPACR
jgi:hypothetical protein